MKTGSDGFLRFGLKTGGLTFSVWGLKIGCSGLVICASKSPQWFLGLCLRIKHDSVCQLCHKTDGGGRRETRVEIWQLASLESKSRYGSPVWPQD
jgi:hypothetical protein